MYNGLESTLWRHILWNAGYFGIIFQVRSLLPKADTKKGQISNDILAGSIGGTVGTILNTPMDVVKYVTPTSSQPTSTGYFPAWPLLTLLFQGLVSRTARRLQAPFPSTTGHGPLS